MTLKPRCSRHSGDIHNSRDHRKSKQVRSNVKIMLTFFFDSCGLVHHEYAQGQNITKEHFLEVIRRPRDGARKKRPNLWGKGTWHLHHNNRIVHYSHLIQTFLTNHNIPLVRQAPCSPRHGSFRFLAVPQIENVAERTRFYPWEDIMRNTTAVYSVLRGHHEVIPTMAGPLGEVYVQSQGRGLRFKTSRWATVFFLVKSWILFWTDVMLPSNADTWKDIAWHRIITLHMFYEQKKTETPLPLLVLDDSAEIQVKTFT